MFQEVMDFQNIRPSNQYTHHGTSGQNFDPLFGKLLKVQQFDGIGTKVYETNYQYDTLRVANQNWDTNLHSVSPNFETTNRMYDEIDFQVLIGIQVFLLNILKRLIRIF